MPILWEHPSGSVSIMQLSDTYLAAHRRPAETTAEAVTRLLVEEQRKNPDLALAVPHLVTTADLPIDRRARGQWRRQGQRVVVDPSVPMPANPIMVVEAEIDQATTIEDMKRALKRVLGVR